MTAAGDLARAAAERGHRWPALVRAVTLAAVLAAAFLIGSQPLFVGAGIAALVILGLFLRRLDLAVAVLAAGFFFNDSLSPRAAIITIDKINVAIAVAARGLDGALNPLLSRPSRGS